MKKFRFIAYATVFALGISGQVLAQGETGIRVGALISQEEGADVSRADFTPGFHAGIFQTTSRQRLFSFQRELLLSYKNLEFFHVVGRENRQVNAQVYSLELPLLLSFNPTSFMSLQVGPQGTMRVSEKVNTLNTKGTDTYSVNKFDLALVGGLAFRTKNGVDLGVRYSNGYRSNVLFQPAGLENTEKTELDVRNWNVQFTMGIRIGGKPAEKARTNPKFKNLPDMFYQNANLD